jgi:hypothetical protein
MEMNDFNSHVSNLIGSESVVDQKSGRMIGATIEFGAANRQAKMLRVVFEGKLTVFLT